MILWTAAAYSSVYQCQLMSSPNDSIHSMKAESDDPSLLCSAKANTMNAKQHCFGSALVSMRIRIQQLGECGLGSRILMAKNLKTITAEKNIFFIISCSLRIPRPTKRTSKLHEKPSNLKRKRAALQNMKFLIFSIFVGHFFPPESGSGSSRPKSMRTHADADPKHQS